MWPIKNRAIHPLPLSRRPGVSPFGFPVYRTQKGQEAAKPRSRAYRALKRLGERIFNNHARIGVQPSKDVVIIRAVPNKVVAIDFNSIRRWVRVRQREFIERFCLSVKAAKLTRQPFLTGVEKLVDHGHVR
jgi:hypothetical protein